jgi:hypothetical protein
MIWLAERTAALVVVIIGSQILFTLYRAGGTRMVRRGHPDQE